MLNIYRYYVIGFIFSLSFVFFSCKKDKHEPIVTDHTVDIYMAGYIEATSSALPVYWKNETMVDTLSTPSGFIGTQPKCIAATGNDVYVGGIALNSHGFPTAMYWKNSQPILLDSGLIGSYVSAVAISGTDIYFSGYVTKSNEQMPVYWKNGLLHYLPITDTTALDTHSIFLNGQDVYITGAGDNYWKNGNLVTTHVNGSIMALGVSGSDLYYAGLSGSYPTFFATYWKNGQATILEEPAGAENRSSDAFAMSVSGPDVYILGTGFVGNTNSYTNRYWVNGKRMEFNNQGLPLLATGIACAGKDVYVSGSRSLGINTTSYVGCYWKNGEPVDFTSNANNIQPLCIFVSEN